MADYTPVEPTQSELLKYHLHVTGRVDAEIEQKKAIKVLHDLQNPPAVVPHAHAQISHDAQKVSTNVSNELVEKRMKKEKAVVKGDAKPSKETGFVHLSSEEVAASLKEMEKQVTNAAARTATAPVEPWKPQVESVIGASIPATVTPNLGTPSFAPWSK